MSGDGFEFHTPPGLGVVLSIIAILIMINNGFMILVIAINKSLLDVTGCLMISLGVADFGVGVSLAIPLIYSWVADSLSSPACDVIGFVGSVMWVVSVFNLMLLSLDRFIAVSRPYEYQRLISLPRALIATLAIWVFSAFLWIFPLNGIGSFKFNDEEYTCHFDMARSPTQWILYMVVIFGPTSLVILICYSKLYLIISRQKRQIASTVVPWAENPQTANNKKAVLTLAIIIGAFYLAWIPFVVEHIVKALRGSLEDVPEWLEITIYVLAASNSFWNPLIYGGTNQCFREKSVKLLQKIWRCKFTQANDPTLEIITIENATVIPESEMPKDISGIYYG